jgi:cellobiose phosphorylase
MNDSKFQIQAGDIRFTFLNSGDLYEATHKMTMINQWNSNPIDGSINNIYLRLHRAPGLQVVPLLGVQSGSSVRYSEYQVTWEGNLDEVQYKVTFSLTEHGVWFWEITVNGHGVEVDVIYGQDVGIANKGAVQSNEAYLSQYIDHAVFDHEDSGYVVCSRQNQPQDKGFFPYLQQGALTRTTGYSTDGFQFFGLSYKETNQPEVLWAESLPNEVYQYEFAYTGLQSERVKLTGPTQFIFYGLFRENHEEAVTSIEFEQDLLHAWEQVKAPHEKVFQSLDKVSISSIYGAPLQTVSMTKEEIEQYFPNRHQEEWDQEHLLSFFTDKHEHVVLKEKEQYVERPHGHIVMTGQNDKMNENILSSTSYMYGIFNSQLVVGNTLFNKMLTNARNALNIMKTSGQRIYIEIDGIYRLLTMPSMFEMGFNYARWYYKTDDEMYIITNLTTIDTPEIVLHVRSVSGRAYRYLVTNQVTLNGNEYEAPFRMEREGQTISFYADEAAMNAKAYPDLCYRLRVEGAEFTLEDERKLASNVVPHSASLVVLELSQASEWIMTFQGLLHGGELPFVKRDMASEIESYREFYRNVMNGFHLSHSDLATEELNKVNALAWWYTHNMLVHYSVLHGLEQYGGAAWGTRDVCQGPTEYFMATHNFDSVKEIIKMVYSHQYEDDGNWPQWFMFDNYYKIQAEESHGDIIVWPLKILGDYLAATKNYSVLQEKVPYRIRSCKEFTEEKATIYDHAKKQIAYMRQHFLHDTFLSSYGDGDWDDTLQPANSQLKKYMISSWTVALTYQVIHQMSHVLAEVEANDAAELQALASGIEADFNRYMLQTEVIPGFIYMEQPGTAEMMLHPKDNKTGINYRLLPMTRSMISELLTPEQAETHYQLIKEKLYYPDGVRLMDRPAKYARGLSTHFKRAEQGANFGREIGLQYVHAHIRFVEAMSKLGKVEEVWNGLAMINPINIHEVVPNAERRQSNSYFSSSDGKFNTRYEAQEQFNKLREGTVSVKGGWRIYSSGPGIYMNQLISNCLGLRQEAGGLVIDPVLPQGFNGLKFDFKFMGQSIKFIYHLNQDSNRVVINGQVVVVERLANRYRQGGYFISKQELIQRLNNQSNIIEIFM